MIAARPFPVRRAIVISFLASAVVASVAWLRLDFAALVSGDAFAALRAVTSRMWPPDLSTKTLGLAGQGALETLSMSIVGSFLGSFFGFVLMPFACENLLVRGPLVEEGRRSAARHAAAMAVHQAARLAANTMRSVPYFVWAVLFWFMVGQGSFPGALAIAVHSGGVVARNYAQALDQIDFRASAALRASGARRTHVFLFGMLPAARTALMSLTLYRWEMNIRESAVLGLVGAGGLGFQLYYAIGVFDWRAAGTYLMGVMALVLVVDALSAFVRRRLL